MKWMKDKYCRKHRPTKFGLQRPCKYGNCTSYVCPECGGIWGGIRLMLCRCETSSSTIRYFRYPPSPALGLKPKDRRKSSKPKKIKR